MIDVKLNLKTSKQYTLFWYNVLCFDFITNFNSNSIKTGLKMLWKSINSNQSK